MIAVSSVQRVLRGRWKSEPAVTVRDPAEAIGRWTRWDSGTDGESPEERQHAARQPAAARPEGARGRRLVP
jgi:hypothetical protein